MATQTPESRNAKRTSLSMRHVTSRYLRPPIGSCHDRCKSGMKDEPELKKHTRRLGVRKMLVKKNKVKRTVEPVERKKFTKTKPKPKPSPDRKICAGDEPVEVIKRERSLPSKRIGVSVYGLLTNQKSTRNGLKLAKNHVKAKPVSSSGFNGQKNKKEVKNIKNTGIVGKSTSVEQVAAKATDTGPSPRNHKPVSPLNDEHSMTKTELKQLITQKITEMTDMTLHEAENAEVELVPLTVEIESPLKDEHGMTKTELKQLIAEKFTEMTLYETENAELEFVPITVEIESPPTVRTESTNLPSSESCQSYSDKQDLEEHENTNDEEVIVSEDDYEMETSEGNCDYSMVICEDKENGGSKVKFMRGRAVEIESEDDGRWKLKIGRGKIPEDNDDGPRRLKFRRGKILEDNEDDGPTRLKFRRGKILEDNEDDDPTRLKFRRGKILEDEDEDDQSNPKINFKRKLVEETTDDCTKESETVTLKHQEMQEKKAQELLNRVIEETASKLEVDRKTKVDALVGAFETVISLQDDTPASQ